MMGPEPKTTDMVQGQTDINYPWLLFQLGENYFAINTRRVTGIMTLPDDICRLPDSPYFVRGLFMLREQIIRLADLRLLFGMTSLDAEREEFEAMLEARKQDHLIWVAELKRCIEAGEEFKLTTDPHKCAFGKWFYSYEAESNSVSHHLRKIEEPHRKLHEAAKAVNECEQQCDACQQPKCLKKILIELEDNLVPQIVNLLDQAKDIFKANFREMAIIIEEGDQRLGLIVDQVLSVEDISQTDVDDSGVNFFHELNYVSGVCQSKNVSSNVLVIDDGKLLNMAGNL